MLPVAEKFLNFKRNFIYAIVYRLLPFFSIAIFSVAGIQKIPNQNLSERLQHLQRPEVSVYVQFPVLIQHVAHLPQHLWRHCKGIELFHGSPRDKLQGIYCGGRQFHLFKIHRAVAVYDHGLQLIDIPGKLPGNPWI